MITKRLRQLRGEAGFSQRVLGEKLGVSQQTVAGWESGRTAPNRRYVARLVDVFGVTSDYLLGISDTRPEPGADSPPIPEHAYLHMARILRSEGITTEDLQSLLQARQAFLKLNR